MIYNISDAIYLGFNPSLDINIYDNYIIEGQFSSSYKINDIIKLKKTKVKKHPIIKNESDFDNKNCPISVVNISNFAPENLITITDMSSMVYENTLEYHKIETLNSTNNIYYINHYNNQLTTIENKIKYLFTDISINNNPLFFKYELLHDVYFEILPDLTIYKNGEIKVDPSEYLIQYSDDNLLTSGTLRYDSSIEWDDSGTSNLKHRIRILLPFSFDDNTNFYTIHYTKIRNDIKTKQIELLDLKPLYTQILIDTDEDSLNEYEFLIRNDENSYNEDIVLLSSAKSIYKETAYLLKDPKYIIKAHNLLYIDNDRNQSNINSSWQLLINTGYFRTSINGLMTLYGINPDASDIKYPMQNTPILGINGNIIKLNFADIYYNENYYTYPNYEIKKYSLEDGVSNEDGAMSIVINGIIRDDIEILSVDSRNGYIQINTYLNIDDKVQVNYFINGKDHLVERLELNPLIPENINTTNIKYFNDTYDGLGIALSSNNENYSYYYSNNEEVLHPLKPVNNNDSTLGIFNTKFSLCYITLNAPSKDMIKLYDVRQIGGGIVKDKLDEYYKNISETRTISDNDRYDGEPLPDAGLIIIHIPTFKLTELLENFNGNRLNRDYYIDRVIRKYISAGTNYIIKDENLNIVKLEV